MVLWRQRALLLCLLPLPSAHAQTAQLQHMYLKYKQEPVDTRPVFSPDQQQYESTLNYKMEFFSVQARPEPPGVVDDIFVCPREADCSLEKPKRIADMELSQPITVEPGGRVLFHFTVRLQGVERNYSIIVNRRKGSETNLRGLIARGITLWPVDEDSDSGVASEPGFREESSQYRCFMDVSTEMAVLKLQLEDAGQVVDARAEVPELLTDTQLRHMQLSYKNSASGSFKMRPVRRLRQSASQSVESEPEGEFQFPAQYLEFPIPLSHKRLIHISVRPADGGSPGHYTVEMARGGCPAASPYFDVAAAGCVRFCNTGFFADEKAGRCKRCHKSCATCLVGDRCARCPPATELEEFIVDKKTGRCKPRLRAPWEQHPQRTGAAVVAAVSLTVFACGLCLSQCQVGSRSEGRRARGGARGGKYMRVSGVDEDERCER